MLNNIFNIIFINIGIKKYIHLCINICMNKKALIGITISLIFVFTAFSPAISNNTNIAHLPACTDRLLQQGSGGPLSRIPLYGKQCERNDDDRIRWERPG